MALGPVQPASSQIRGNAPSEASGAPAAPRTEPRVQLAEAKILRLHDNLPLERVLNSMNRGKVPLADAFKEIGELQQRAGLPPLRSPRP